MSEPMDLIYKDPKYPSSKVVNGLSMAGPRAHLRGMGLVNEELAKPFIGVINTYNEMHPGHIHLNRIGQLVKDGVREAGGVPFEVNTISLCDGFSQGHVGMCSVLPSREVIADSIEVYAGGHQLDGLVLIGGCDKIVPAMIMAALRINLPTVLVTGGPMMPAVYKGKQYGTYELKEMAGKLTRGEISREEYEYMEGLMSPTPGSCAMMGTANTMSIIAEAMGLTMPGSACAHAVSGKKNRVAKESGMAVVRLVEEDIRPRDIVTQEMLELAVRVGLSVGGSTNMTLHMPAIAHEAKLHMSLEEIGRLSAETPYLAKIKPSGSHTMLDLDQAGGVGAVMRELDGLINLDQMTVNGKTHRQNVERVVEHNPEVIRPVSDAYSDHGSITVAAFVKELCCTTLSNAISCSMRIAEPPFFRPHRGPQSDRLGYGIPHVAAGEPLASRSHNVAGAVSVVQNLDNGRLNRVGLNGHMEGEAEHQCRREDLGNGIGNVLAGNVRR